MAQKSAYRSAKETGSLMPPSHILIAPTRLMKDIGYGKGYAYDHDAEEGFSGQDYWPEGMDPQTFYEPADRGFEAALARFVEGLRLHFFGPVILAGKALVGVMVVGIALAVANVFHEPGRGVQDMRRGHQGASLLRASPG